MLGFVFNKEGLRYNMNSNRNIKNFLKASNNTHPTISCHHCGKNGHRTKTNWEFKTLKRKDILKYGFLKLFQEL